jgi:hypothetical protein
MNYSDNDDDLFDYDPTVSDTSHNTVNSNKEFTKNFSTKIDEDKSLDIESGNLDNAKIRIASAFHGAANHFLTEVGQQSAIKSIFLTLNTITNGDFHLLCYFHELEMRISRRMILIDISREAFKLNNTENGTKVDPGFVKVIKDFFNIELTDFYIKSFFLGTMNILEHTLTLERAMYLTLGKKLGIPVKQYLFVNIENMSDEEHEVYLDDYRMQMEKDIITTLNNEGVVQELENVFDRKIIFHDKKIS